MMESLIKKQTFVFLFPVGKYKGLLPLYWIWLLGAKRIFK